MNKSEYIDLIREQAFDLATAEVRRREEARSENEGRRFVITPFDGSKVPPPRERDGERAWAELASTLLDYDAWQSIAEYLEDSVKGLSGTSWLEGRFDGLQLACGTPIIK